MTITEAMDYLSTLPGWWQLEGGDAIIQDYFGWPSRVCARFSSMDIPNIEAYGNTPLEALDLLIIQIKEYQG